MKTPDDAAIEDIRNLRTKDFSPADLSYLCSLDLNFQQLTKTGKRIQRDRGLASSEVKSTLLGVTSNGTFSHLSPALIATARRYGLEIDVVEGGYGLAVQDALDPQSNINSVDVDYVLIAYDYRGLPFTEFNDDQSGAEEALQFIRNIAEGFLQNGAKSVIVQTLAYPEETIFGNVARNIETSKRRQILDFNQGLSRLCNKCNYLLLDIEALANRIGSANWFDPVGWSLAKLPFDTEFAPHYSDQLTRLLSASLGKSKKCLVLDLDNTLWGGVIGDDGLGGISLGQGSPEGEAFIHFQRYALSLKERGIMLAVCSKNSHDIAMLPFTEHNEMVLKSSDIVAFVANWQPKSQNLIQIAKTLNIGIDALVFFDDNPAEREQVRQELPQVAVIEVPEDPAYYAKTLANSGWFETLGLTDEDLVRTQGYISEEKRRGVKNASLDLDSFHQSLEMSAIIDKSNDQSRERIAQLLGKTNQFNFTQKKFSIETLNQFESSGDHLVLQIRLRDKFGEAGIVSVLICDIDAKILNIQNWVMSCRVFGRGLEYAIFNSMVDIANQNNLEVITLKYNPTDRNGVISDLPAKLGLKLVSADENEWSTSTVNYTDAKHRINVTNNVVKALE